MTRILVVDDDVQTARVLVEYLRLSGYQPVSEPDGLRALQHLDLRQPELLILDLMLPGITGVEIARRVRLDRESEHIPILAITGIEQPEDLVDVLMVDRILAKPLDLDAFGEAVEELLASSSDSNAETAEQSRRSTLIFDP
jgi:DNA-binding response OmpR family regulator